MELIHYCQILSTGSFEHELFGVIIVKVVNAVSDSSIRNRLHKISAAPLFRKCKKAQVRICVNVMPGDVVQNRHLCPRTIGSQEGEFRLFLRRFPVHHRAFWRTTICSAIFTLQLILTLVSTALSPLGDSLVEIKMGWKVGKFRLLEQSNLTLYKPETIAHTYYALPLSF